MSCPERAQIMLHSESECLRQCVSTHGCTEGCYFTHVDSGDTEEKIEALQYVPASRDHIALVCSFSSFTKGQFSASASLQG